MKSHSDYEIDAEAAAILGQPRFRCVVCGVERHHPTFPYQIICGPCIIRGKQRTYERYCPCGARILGGIRDNRCPDCYKPVRETKEAMLADPYHLARTVVYDGPDPCFDNAVRELEE